MMLDTLNELISPLVIIALGLFILARNKALAHQNLERDRESRFLSFLRFKYDEGPLRIQIVIAGIALTAFGTIGLVLSLTNNAGEAFEGVRVAIIGLALIILCAGIMGVVVMLTMTKNK